MYPSTSLPNGHLGLLVRTCSLTYTDHGNCLRNIREWTGSVTSHEVSWQWFVWSETISARDVVQKLCDMGISSTQDFNWISQLRYYWTEGHVVVSMITTDVLYGFEYLGNTPRLVITPLTDRCYR